MHQRYVFLMSVASLTLCANDDTKTQKTKTEPNAATVVAATKETLQSTPYVLAPSMRGALPSSPFRGEKKEEPTVPYWEDFPSGR